MKAKFVLLTCCVEKLITLPARYFFCLEIMWRNLEPTFKLWGKTTVQIIDKLVHCNVKLHCNSDGLGEDGIELSGQYDQVEMPLGRYVFGSTYWSKQNIIISVFHTLHLIFMIFGKGKENGGRTWEVQCR